MTTTTMTMTTMMMMMSEDIIYLCVIYVVSWPLHYNSFRSPVINFFPEPFFFLMDNESDIDCHVPVMKDLNSGKV